MTVRSFNSRSTTPTTPPPASGGGGDGPRGRLGWLKPRDRVLLALVVVVTLGVGVAVLIGRTHHIAAPGGPSASVSASRAGLPGNLAWGTVQAGAGAGTGTVYGVPVGFPHTRDGALAAAVNYTGAEAAQGTWNTDEAPAIEKAVFAPSYLADKETWDAVAQFRQAMRAKYSLNNQGQVMTGGVVDPTQVFLSRCDPRFGAYRPVSVEADKAVVDVWGPCVIGVAAALPDFTGTTLTWSTARTTVEWTGTSWQVTGSDSAGPDAPATPAADKQAIPPSFATRAATLPGDGWLLPRNAVETFDPVTEWETAP